MLDTLKRIDLANKIERVEAWADVVRSAVALMAAHAQHDGTFDEELRDIANEAFEEFLCCFELLPVPEGCHGDK